MDQVLSKIVSIVSAARQFNIPQEQIDAAAGMVVNSRLPYELYKKLGMIENKNFADFLNIALVSNYEDYISARKEQNIIVSPFEELFLKCAIPFGEREKIVIDFLKNLKDPKKLDLTNLTYSNPKF